MNLSFFKSESKLAFPRCEHRSPSGRQCSQPLCTTDPRFCDTHKPTPEQLASAELIQAAGTLSSPDEVHCFLKAVLLNRVRGRITPKEASVYSYLCQNLLRSLREIDHFQQLQSEREERNRPPRKISWNVPRGDRSDPPKSNWNVPTGIRPDDPVPVQSVSTNSTAQIPENSSANSIPAESSAPTPGAAASPSESFTSPTSFTSSTSTPPAAASSPKSATSSASSTSNVPPPPFDPRHFFPLDPTLPRGAQDHSRNIPPPDEAECRRLAARRGLLFNRRPAPNGAIR
jgi:hypothetical protein